MSEYDEAEFVESTGKVAVVESESLETHATFWWGFHQLGREPIGAGPKCSKPCVLAVETASGVLNSRYDSSSHP
jgi:hypothetical protein